MTSIQTTHRGHLIAYSDNADSWWCSDWNYSNASLQKVRARIDSEYLKMRKGAALDCFELSGYDPPKITPAKLIEYIGEKWDRNYSSQNGMKFAGHRVASVATRHSNEKASRREAMLHQFIPDTPEAMAALENAVRLYNAASDAKKIADAALADVPRVTPEMIADLMKVANQKSPEEQEQNP